MTGLPEPPAEGASALPQGTFDGQVVVVTGGGTGLGRATAGISSSESLTGGHPPCPARAEIGPLCGGVNRNRAPPTRHAIQFPPSTPSVAAA